MLGASIEKAFAKIIKVSVDLTHIMTFKYRFAIILLFSLLLIPGSHAQIPASLPEKVLREPNPFSFITLDTVVDLAPEDFQIVDEKYKNYSWIPGSLQWVRVWNAKDEAGILVPRARVHTESGDFEVALTQTENPIQLKFKPRTELKTHYYFDSSCSPYSLRMNNAKLSHSWVMVSCHRANDESEKGTKSELMVTMLWESETASTTPKGSAPIQFILNSEHSKQSFDNGQDSFEVQVWVWPSPKN